MSFRRSARALALRCTISSLTLMLPLVLLTSCAAPRPEPKPLSALPESFSRSGHEALPRQWWRSFDDPTLDHLIEQALSDNLSLRAVWDRLAQAEAIARKAGAPLWPSVEGSASASKTRTDQVVESATGDSRSVTRRDNLSLGLSASYELDLWGRIRSTRDAAALDVQATREQVQAAAMTLSAQVAATWYALVEQYGQVDVLNRQLKSNQNVLDLITIRFRRGQVGAADVLRQRQLVESNRGNIVSVKAQVALLEHQLAILLGQAPKSLVAQPSTNLVSLPPLPDTGVPADLVQQRPDIRQAYFAVMAADRRVAAAVADQFPRIGLSADVNTSGERWRDLFNNWMASLAANIVAPLFDAGLRRAEVERTRAVVSESLNSYGQTVLNALGEVEDALALEQQQQRYIASLEKQFELSQQTIDRIRDSYSYGAVNYLDILQALVSQQSLERQLLQARRELLQDRIDLCRALGGDWELERPQPATLNTAMTDDHDK